VACRAAPPRYRGDDTIYTGLRRAIVEGRYPRGARLREQHLTAEFEVSRTPIREALLRLETEGLMVVERNQGHGTLGVGARGQRRHPTSALFDHPDAVYTALLE
jgi:DNA-binding FadR family transcriptional regulator